jgi:hypothetical protein
MNIHEERLVAELENLGVRYLSRQSGPVEPLFDSPARFLADLIRQPSSRVRTALIAVLLAQPALAKTVPSALKLLNPEDQLTLKLFYTAAMFLQKKHAERLRSFLGNRWQWLPDLYSAELGMDTARPPDELLHALGITHRQQTGISLNWAGTYENVAHHLLRRWELEKQWNQ